MLVRVTCRVDECVNCNYPLEFIDPADLVICGPCGNEITDKVVVEE